MNRKISYLECTTTRRRRGLSPFAIFLFGFGLGAFCVYGATKLAAML